MPARKQNRNMGSVPAADSRATKIGSAVRLVISQAAPVPCIQPPVLDSRLASHNVRKARVARGAKADGWLTGWGDGGAFTTPSHRGDGSCSARRPPSG